MPVAGTGSEAPIDQPTAGGGGEPQPEPEAQATKLVVDVTTLSQGGRYAPKNIGAIWVEDSSGAWVKTLAVWAGRRGRNLQRYLGVNPTNNTVDAVTSATLRTHEGHTVEWDLTGLDGGTVPDGEYTILVECTEADRAGEFTSASFTKGEGPQQATFDNRYYEGSISYE